MYVRPKTMTTPQLASFKVPVVDNEPMVSKRALFSLARSLNIDRVIMLWARRSEEAWRQP